MKNSELIDRTWQAAISNLVIHAEYRLWETQRRYMPHTNSRDAVRAVAIIVREQYRLATDAGLQAECHDAFRQGVETMRRYFEAYPLGGKRRTNP